MVPSVGRIVHFVEASGETNTCRAAIITGVEQYDISLTVFTPEGQYIAKATHDETEKPADTWHEPERV